MVGLFFVLGGVVAFCSLLWLSVAQSRGSKISRFPQVPVWHVSLTRKDVAFHDIQTEQNPLRPDW